ncbi:Afadin [Merluccius polli]|uniref:Afadin n=1 Tax=Merluccius polli TaxID=89951 RepID=A0AA47P1R9_MERPO|nr:Afadin [Merluccius polli]
MAHRKALQRVINTAQRIIGHPLPSLQDLYSTRCLRKARSILKDSSHPGHRVFQLLPSGRRFRMLKTQTNRIRDGFYNRAIALLNENSRHICDILSRSREDPHGFVMSGSREEERRKLADIINHWNANRLDLFEISQPTEAGKINAVFGLAPIPLLIEKNRKQEASRKCLLCGDRSTSWGLSGEAQQKRMTCFSFVNPVGSCFHNHCFLKSQFYAIWF